MGCGDAVHDLPILHPAEPLARELLKVLVIRLEAPDALSQLLVVLLQSEGGVFQLTLFPAHPQQVNQAMIAEHRGHDEKNQRGDPHRNGAFVFHG